jgi:hypothetical protein
MSRPPLDHSRYGKGRNLRIMLTPMDGCNRVNSNGLVLVVGQRA